MSLASSKGADSSLQFAGLSPVDLGSVRFFCAGTALPLKIEKKNLLQN